VFLEVEYPKLNVMSTKSEQGFGARMQRSKELSNYIASFVDYNPPKAEDQAAAFQELINQIEAANTQAISTKEFYTMAVAQRQKVFSENPDSLKAILSQLRPTLIAIYGKDSKELKIISDVLRKIRGTKLVKAPKTLESPTQLSNSSISERSFGSLILYFKSIIVNLEQFENYSSFNPNLTIEGLNALLDALNNTSIQVSSTSLNLQNARKIRMDLYSELDKRSLRIRNYVLSKYGKSSVEYKAVRKL
jgi:hypothetical protein